MLHKNNKSVLKYMLGEKSFSNLPSILNERRIAEEGCVIFIVDEFFKENEVFVLDLKNDDELFFVETSKKEPTKINK